MKLTPILLLGGLATLCAGSLARAASAQGKSLEECFQAALARSESIAVQGELLAQAEERHRQAFGGVLPSVSASAQELWQATPESALSSGLFPAVQPLVKFTATQPLYRGFREFAGIRATQGLVAAQLETRRNAAILLFNDVVQAFFSVLLLEQDLRDLDQEISLYVKRIRELNERRRIGRSRQSEVLSTESAMSALKSQLEAEKGQLAAAREVLFFLTDFDRATPLKHELAAPEAPQPLAQDLRRVELRPDVRAELRRSQAAQEGIRIALGAHLPSADLNGNYYLLRSGSLKDVNWDVTFSLSLPLYNGGAISSRVVEAESVERQAALSLNLIKRQAEQQIRTLHAVVQAELAQLKALKEASGLAERNYHEQIRDYALGLVTNLDVLQALTAFQESHRALDRVRFAFEQDRMRLEASVFRRPVLVGESWEASK